MKLRIRGNSVRLRLTRTEVAAIGAGQTVSQVTPFSPKTRLTTCLRVSDDAGMPMAAFADGEVIVVLPRELARRWAESEEVSLAATQRVSDGESLSLLVEKDFECVHHPAEGGDAYPNPRERKNQ